MVTRPVAALLVLVVAAAAQPSMNERRQYDRLERRRAELLRICLKLPSERLTPVSEALAKADGAWPFQTLERAFLAARDQKIDKQRLFRSGLVLLTSPEVVDWVGLRGSDAVPRFDKINLTVWAPRAMAMPDKVGFRLRILNRAGKQVWTGDIDKKLDMRDLRAFRAMKSVQVKEFPVGHYEVEARTLLDGKEPQPNDRVLRASFAVMPGFVERYAKRFRAVGELENKLTPFQWAALTGAARSADRYFRGEPGPVNDCEGLMRTLEKILANVRPVEVPAVKPASQPTFQPSKKHPLQGLEGWVRIELPNADLHAAQVALRLTSDPAVKVEGARPPLVLFMPGAPAWTATGRRPESPPSLAPGYLANLLEVAGFDRAGHFQLAVLESPGRVQNTLATLENVLKNLPKLVRYDASKIVLVGDRQGASGLASLALRHPARVRGLVLCNGGAEAVTLNNIEKLGDTKVLLVTGRGHPGGAALRRHLKLAQDEGKAGTLQMVPRNNLPWCLALPMVAAKELEGFVYRAIK